MICHVFRTLRKQHSHRQRDRQTDTHTYTHTHTHTHTHIHTHTHMSGGINVQTAQGDQSKSFKFQVWHSPRA